MMNGHIHQERLFESVVAMAWDGSPVGIAAEIQIDGMCCSQAILVNQSHHGAYRRIEAIVLADYQDLIKSRGQLNHLPSLFEGGSKRFFDQHMPSSLKGRHGDRYVIGQGGCYEHRLTLYYFQGLLDRSEAALGRHAQGLDARQHSSININAADQLKILRFQHDICQPVLAPTSHSNLDDT